MKLDLDRIGTELGQKAKIEENPPKPRREKQAGLGEKLKNRIFAPTERNKISKIKISGGKSTWIL